MGSQLRWLERTPDKRKVGGSSPLEPTSSASCPKPKRFVEAETANQAKLDLANIKRETFYVLCTLKIEQ